MNIAVRYQSKTGHTAAAWAKRIVDFSQAPQVPD
jgi:hypothetical protein